MSVIKVLAVDDSSVSRQVIALLLASDREIDLAASAGSAQEAWNQLQAYNIDVITLDLDLPDGDGLEMLELLTFKDTCGVVVVSGDDRQHKLAIQLGATACFEKLTLLNEQNRFLDAIHRAAKGSRQQTMH
jgi:two-component system, chemotaxis family, protein-glutamate methylesterase/glutaminase